MITVSEALEILSCPKKFQFRHDEGLAHLRKPRSVISALGDLMHSSFEAVDKGNFDAAADSELHQKYLEWWEKSARQSFTDLASQCTFGSPPTVERWPGYMRNRGRGFARLMSRRRNRGQGHGGRPPEVEEPLKSMALNLYGRVDRIEHSQFGYTIVDFKSTPHAPSETPTRYVHQMYLYAALAQEVFGSWPESLVIQWGDETRTVIEVEPSNIANVIVNLHDIQLAISNGTALANPQESNCTQCDFRTECVDYLGAEERFDWRWQPHFVIGNILAKSHNAQGAVTSIRVKNSSQIDLVEVSVQNDGIPLPADVGSEVVLDRLKHVGGANFRLTWEGRFNPKV